MAKTAERISYKTPFGTVRWPYLNQPDTKFVKKEGDKALYKSDIVFSDADLPQVKKMIGDALKAFFGNEETVDPVKEFFSDKERKNSQGWGLSVKSYRKPAILDGRNEPIPAKVEIGAGSVVRFAGTLVPYEMKDTETVIENGKKSVRQVTNRGVTIYVDQVQVRSLVAGMAAPQFDVDPEGFTYEADNDAPFEVDASVDL